MTDTEDERNTIDTTCETLGGDLASWLVDRLRQQPKTYGEMSEQEQRETIESATMAVNSMLRRAVALIAADDRKVIVAEVEKVEFKDGIKAVISCSKSSEYRHDLADAQGQTVLIVVADADKYLGGERPEAEPDQGALFDKTGMGAEDVGPDDGDREPAAAE